jgi:hypothetical protein
VIAALSAWHEQHELAAESLAEVTALPGHVVIEAYSVLTRLPSGLAVPAATAARTLSERFGAPAFRLGGRGRAEVLERLATAGVYGGATYDGLVALEAAAHGQVLATLDQRAIATYRRLAVPFRELA